MPINKNKDKPANPAPAEFMPGANGGVLRRGNPGNRGGGNLRARVRALMADGVEEAVPHIIKIAKGKEDGVSPGESVAAFNTLAKHSIGEITSVLVEDETVCTIAVRVFYDLVPDAELLARFSDELLRRLQDQAETLPEGE